MYERMDASSVFARLMPAPAATLQRIEIEYGIDAGVLARASEKGEKKETRPHIAEPDLSVAPLSFFRSDKAVVSGKEEKESCIVFEDAKGFHSYSLVSVDKFGARVWNVMHFLLMR